MVRFVRLTLFVYAVWLAVYVGSQVADWAHSAFTKAGVRVAAALN
jgi:hypothetical protein